MTTMTDSKAADVLAAHNESGIALRDLLRDQEEGK